ncbi:DUF2726 domain-containing protein [Gilvimarinus xylanilyticus]|uniref:DUF2726 domain-containing protein n=1 Tax=Gilvimarinus xylanilyticus TaxID=2944139 RepID=A0A9X2HWP6_9GAMM|nr:DUF2726 domain-containing protein [Gilvimarinus xylanilyticus]MCP8899059.1 DUF2726 domain-containing protein [Gilvimarinus xylanilyticus]
MEYLILIVLVLAVLAILGVATAKRQYGYRKHVTLFTKAERSFLGVLDQAVGEEYRIFGKVRVADILAPEKGMSRKSWRTAFNKISGKHFDYVLCKKSDLSVIAVVELDDKSHRGSRAKARDSFLENACSSAGLTLVRFPAKASYQVHSVRDSLHKAISPKADHNSSSAGHKK